MFLKNNCNLLKKRVDECNKGFFLKKTQNSPYLEGKNLEVPKFKQCVLVGC